MKENKHNHQKVEETFEVLDAIKETQVSPFFKQRVLNAMFRKEENPVSIHWFTPKLQLAAIALIILINVFSLVYVFNQNTSSNLEIFAKEYRLSSSESILNSYR